MDNIFVRAVRFSLSIITIHRLYEVTSEARSFSTNPLDSLLCSSAWHRGNKRKADNSVEAGPRVLTVSLHNKLETCVIVRAGCCGWSHWLRVCVCVYMHVCAFVVHTPTVVAGAQILRAPSRGCNTRVPVMEQFFSSQDLYWAHTLISDCLIECLHLWPYISGQWQQFQLQ
jgi:hypothetical protein